MFDDEPDFEVIEPFEFPSKFEIDTGSIYLNLSTNWKSFNRDFLLEVEDALRDILKQNNIITIEYNGKKGIKSNAQVIKKYENLLLSNLNHFEQVKNFPFPRFFLIPDKNIKYQSVVTYDSYCSVNATDKDFDLFFAIKLWLVDLMEIDAFLEFQFLKNFGNNIVKFNGFLQKLCLKYHEFLFIKHEPLTKIFIDRFSIISKPQDSKIHNLEISKSKQVLAIHYLLKKMNAYNLSSKINIAVFIQFLIEKDANSKNIKDSNIYKILKKPLDRNSKQIFEDLDYIRKFYLQMGLQSIVDEIDKDIYSINPKKGVPPKQSLR